MPERLDDMFSRLHQDTGHLLWKEATDVRERGQRRTRNRLIGGTLAVLLVAGLGAGTAWATLGRGDRDPDRTATPGPSITATSPAPTPPSETPRTPGPSANPTTPESPPPVGAPIPGAALLQGRDIGPGFVTDTETEGEDHGSIAFLMSYCRQMTSADYRGGASRQGSVHDPRDRDPNGTHRRYVLEEAKRHEHGWAARRMRDLRAAVSRCRTVDLGGSPDYQAALTIVASSFTGDDSILVKDVTTTPEGVQPTQWHVAIRQGDVYAHIRIHVAGTTQSQAIEIGRRAAQRLCAATPSC